MDLERDFEVLRVEDSKDDQWDFIFNLVGDEIRERNSYRESFRDEPVSRHTETLPELDGVARAAFSVSRSIGMEEILSSLIFLHRCCWKRPENLITSTSLLLCLIAVENSMSPMQSQAWRKRTALRR